MRVLQKQLSAFEETIQIRSFLVTFVGSTSQYSEGINFDQLNGWKCWNSFQQNPLYRSRVTQHLRNGGPVEMISIEKLIKNMVLLDQFSNIMLN